jgi:hypothetical protein
MITAASTPPVVGLMLGDVTGIGAEIAVSTLPLRPFGAPLLESGAKAE